MSVPAIEVAGTVAPTETRSEPMAAPDKPALAAGVERRDFGSYGVVAPPGGGSMLHLEPDEFALLDLMDGTHTEAEIESIAGGTGDRTGR